MSGSTDNAGSAGRRLKFPAESVRDSDRTHPIDDRDRPDSVARVDEISHKRRLVETGFLI